MYRMGRSITNVLSPKTEGQTKRTLISLHFTTAVPTGHFLLMIRGQIPPEPMYRMPKIKGLYMLVSCFFFLGVMGV